MNNFSTLPLDVLLNIKDELEAALHERLDAKYSGMTKEAKRNFSYIANQGFGFTIGRTGEFDIVFTPQDLLADNFFIEFFQEKDRPRLEQLEIDDCM